MQYSYESPSTSKDSRKSGTPRCVTSDSQDATDNTRDEDAFTKRRPVNRSLFSGLCSGQAHGCKFPTDAVSAKHTHDEEGVQPGSSPKRAKGEGSFQVIGFLTEKEEETGAETPSIFSDDELGPTQEPDWSQCSQAPLAGGACADGSTSILLYLCDAVSHEMILIPQKFSPFSIGRGKTNDYIANHGCVGLYHCQIRCDRGFEIYAWNNTCWVWSFGKWTQLNKGCCEKLRHVQHFRLVCPSLDSRAFGKGVEFSLAEICHGDNSTPGSVSFDREYKRLLQLLKSPEKGRDQMNKKGRNRTLLGPYTLTIDLSNSEGKDLLPVSTLRDMHQGRAAIIDALWYLRGEDHIHFLTANHCSFWDKQAKGDGFLGLNYGLLTNYPTGNSNTVNQLETKVIQKLCRGETSRNMFCTLANPSEFTVQESCSSGVQFSVSDGTLYMTINQRSSDLILGLPHDVIVWTFIFHLVRREVKRRSGIELAAGKIYFSIAAGGAHVYEINRDAFEELLKRHPILDAMPHLVIESKVEEDEDIFSIARNYKGRDGLTTFRVVGYGDKHYPKMHVEQACEK